MEFPMQFKHVVSAIVAVSLLGTPAIALAQNEAGQSDAATQGAPRTKAPVSHHKMRSSHHATSHHMTSHHMKAGTTTGMGTGTSKAATGGQY